MKKWVMVLMAVIFAVVFIVLIVIYNSNNSGENNGSDRQIDSFLKHKENINKGKELKFKQMDKEQLKKMIRKKKKRKI